MKETLLLTKHMRENPENSHLIDVYEKNNGYSAARKVFKENNPGDVIEEIKTSNIRGRGGAGFPTGVKWGFLAEDEERYLVINADESEPGTFKDRILLERDPHQLIEGIIVTSFASNISKAFIYIRGEYAKPARRVQDAVEQAYEKGYLLSPRDNDINYNLNYVRNQIRDRIIPPEDFFLAEHFSMTFDHIFKHFFTFFCSNALLF